MQWGVPINVCRDSNVSQLGVIGTKESWQLQGWSKDTSGQPWLPQQELGRRHGRKSALVGGEDEDRAVERGGMRHYPGFKINPGVSM